MEIWKLQKYCINNWIQIRMVRNKQTNDISLLRCSSSSAECILRPYVLCPHLYSFSLAIMFPNLLALYQSYLVSGFMWAISAPITHRLRIHPPIFPWKEEDSIKIFIARLSTSGRPRVAFINSYLKRFHFKSCPVTSADLGHATNRAPPDLASTFSTLSASLTDSFTPW